MIAKPRHLRGSTGGLPNMPQRTRHFATTHKTKVTNCTTIQRSWRSLCTNYTLPSQLVEMWHGKIRRENDPTSRYHTLSMTCPMVPDWTSNTGPGSSPTAWYSTMCSLMETGVTLWSELGGVQLTSPISAPLADVYMCARQEVALSSWNSASTTDGS
jgi:hypothetical protein